MALEKESENKDKKANYYKQKDYWGKFWVEIVFSKDWYNFLNICIYKQFGKSYQKQKTKQKNLHKVFN